MKFCGPYMLMEYHQLPNIVLQARGPIRPMVKYYFNEDITIELSATDATSGVKKNILHFE